MFLRTRAAGAARSCLLQNRDRLFSMCDIT